MSPFCNSSSWSSLIPCRKNCTEMSIYQETHFHAMSSHTAQVPDQPACQHFWKCFCLVWFYAYLDGGHGIGFHVESWIPSFIESTIIWLLVDKAKKRQGRSIFIHVLLQRNRETEAKRFQETTQSCLVPLLEAVYILCATAHVDPAIPGTGSLAGPFHNVVRKHDSLSSSCIIIIITTITTITIITESAIKLQPTYEKPSQGVFKTRDDQRWFAFTFSTIASLVFLSSVSSKYRLGFTLLGFQTLITSG